MKRIYQGKKPITTPVSIQRLLVAVGLYERMYVLLKLNFCTKIMIGRGVYFTRKKGKTQFITLSTQCIVSRMKYFDDGDQTMQS